MYFVRNTLYILNKIPVFDADSNIYYLWSLLQLATILMFIFFVPINIIYDLSYDNLMNDFIVKSCPILWLLECIISLNIGYFDKGEYVTNRQQILRNFLHKTLLDELLSIVPVSIEIYIK